MTFSMTPRSRSPVLSICTQSENADNMLRAEIEAATSQQERIKRRKTRYSIEPTIKEESDSNDVDDDYNCKRCERHSRRSERRQSFSSSMKSISGTVKGELSSAKKFLKNTSLRHLHRIRPRTTTSCSKSTPQSARTEDFDVDWFSQYSSMPAELSSDPLCQLEDNQRPSTNAEEYRIPFSSFPDYEKDMSLERSLYKIKSGEAGDLSFKSYACDSCQHQLRGGDLYDFCALCGPSDRVLCIACARQQKCRRHEDAVNLGILHSARNSPAPPYSRPHYIQCETQNGLPHLFEDPSTNHSDPMDSRSRREQSETGVQSTTRSHDATNITTARNPHHFVTRKISIREGGQSFDQPAPEQERMSAALRERETTLREQQAAVREERATLKEQEVLLREREHLSRERDALVIRNLQTLVTFQELARHGFGAQFPASKGDDFPPNNLPEPGSKSLFNASKDDRISLENLCQDHTPNQALKNVVAQVEASITDPDSVDDYTRNHPAQKRKKEGGKQQHAASSVKQEPTKSGSSRERSKRNASSPLDNHDEDDTEEEEPTPPKKQKQDSPDIDIPQRIFACPYCKYDSIRYSPRNLAEKHYRGCSGHFLPDIPRLKQHLRRVHWRPEHHCPRCFEVFNGPSDLTRHFEQAVACSKQKCPFPEKMDETQRKQIHIKRPRVSPETLWYDIYKVLFPESTLPDSPYADAPCVEDDELVSPTSAAPSSAHTEEATQRMVQIFNERLDKHKGRPGHDWLMSRELRQLITSEIVGSMADLFTNMSLISGTASESQGSAPESAAESPIISSSSNGTSHTYKTSQVTSDGGSSDTGTPIKKRKAMQAAPRLKEPKRLLSPALRDPISNFRDRTNHAHVSADTEHLLQSQDRFQPVPHARKLQKNLLSLIDDLTPGAEHKSFQNDSTVDSGWDEESHSFEPGDDRDAMVVMQANEAMPSHFPQESFLQAPKPKRMYQRPPHFVPVRLETLADDLGNEHSQNQLLQPHKSVASLVDSGYGSGRSDHPEPRMLSDQDDEDMSDDISPIGHETFEEQFELWQNIAQNFNPWQGEEDLRGVE